MTVKLDDAERHPSLLAAASLVSPVVFTDRNGPSKKYEEGRAALAAESSTPPAEKFLAYASGLAAAGRAVDPDAAAHRLGGALSCLSVVELARAVILLTEHCDHAGDLLSAIRGAPALACLPAPLLSLVAPGEARSEVNRYSVKFGDHTVGVAGLGGGTDLGVLAIEEATPGYPSYEQRFLAAADKYTAGSAVAPTSYALVNGAAWNDAHLAPLRDLLLAQRSFGTRSSQLVAAVRTDLQFSPEFVSRLPAHPRKGARADSNRARRAALSHGPAELSLALAMDPDVLAVKTAPGWPTSYETRSVLVRFGKPLTKYWYPHEVVENARNALLVARERANTTASEAGACRRAPAPPTSVRSRRGPVF